MLSVVAGDFADEERLAEGAASLEVLEIGPGRAGMAKGVRRVRLPADGDEGAPGARRRDRGGKGIPSIQLKTAAGWRPMPSVRHKIASSEKSRAAAEHAETEANVLQEIFD